MQTAIDCMGSTAEQSRCSTGFMRARCHVIHCSSKSQSNRVVDYFKVWLHINPISVSEKVQLLVRLLTGES